MCNGNLVHYKYGRSKNSYPDYCKTFVVCGIQVFCCSVRVRDQYLNGRGISPSLWSCKIQDQSCSSHSFVSKAYCLFCLGNESTSGDIDFPVRVSKAWIPSSSRRPTSFVCLYLTRVDKFDIILVNFRTNLPSTLHDRKRIVIRWQWFVFWVCYLRLQYD